MAKGLLEGIRVVDWTVYQVGPCATAMLADLGAEVIHVEEPEHGDLLRGNMTLGGVELVRPDGRQLNFEEHNRNKKGIAIDLKKKEGQDIIYRLVAKSDIFVTNLRHAAIKKLGMDYETLKKHNSKLIYARASGFGDVGPITERPSLDHVGRARSGFAMGGGDLGDTPVYNSPGVGDRLVSLYLVYGILAALYGRDRWGIGQEVITSQLGSLVAIQGFCITPTLFQDVPREFPRQEKGAHPMREFYRCKDGKWILVGFAEQIGPRWAEFWNTLEMPGMVDDPRFNTYGARAKHCNELAGIIADKFASKTQKEWEDIFDKTDVLVTGCLEIPDVRNDPQVLANKYVTDWNHPTLGRIKFVGFPVQFSETPPEFKLAAPVLGQHTEEVLTEIGGCTWEDIARLKAKKVIP
ncbi:MAG: CoA transferase [Dehalococcoidales bacterium]|nr:CoA transferase [Dehalococcoidales bacterium]